MPYLFLFLSLISSVVIALMLKMYDRRGFDGVLVIAANYPVAIVLSILLSRNLALDWPALLMAMVMGLLFFSSFVLYGKAIARDGVASSVTMGRMSLAIPVGLSILLWGEMPKIHHWPALLAIMAVIFFWEGKGKRLSWLLVSVFFLFGIIDTGMKFFKSHFTEIDESAFLLALFISAAIWAWLTVFIKKIPRHKSALLGGLLLGIPNFFSSFFLLMSLRHLPGYQVFPFINVGSVLLAYVAGWWFFDEKLGQRKLLLLAMGSLAVLLLTL